MNDSFLEKLKAGAEAAAKNSKHHKKLKKKTQILIVIGIVIAVCGGIGAVL